MPTKISSHKNIYCTLSKCIYSQFEEICNFWADFSLIKFGNVQLLDNIYYFRFLFGKEIYAERSQVYKWSESDHCHSVFVSIVKCEVRSKTA